MSSQQIQESPNRTTAGLTSAKQLVDVTSTVTYDIRNSTSAMPIYYVVPVEPMPEKIEPKPSKNEQFLKALRTSMRRNKEILDELAKV